MSIATAPPLAHVHTESDSIATPEQRAAVVRLFAKHRRTCTDNHADPKNWLDLSPDSGRIKTVCKFCNAFIGYRPVSLTRG